MLNPIKSHKIPFNHHVPITFPSFSHDFPTVFPWVFPSAAMKICWRGAMMRPVRLPDLRPLHRCHWEIWFLWIYIYIYIYIYTYIYIYIYVFYIYIYTWIPHWYLNFCAGGRVRKKGANLGSGPMPTKSGRFRKKTFVANQLSCSLDNLLGKLGVLHPDTLSPAKWTRIYIHLRSLRYFGAWTNKISEFRSTEFKKRTVFGIMFGPLLLYLPFFKFAARLRIFARVLRIFARILHFPGWQGTCHNQKKYEKKNKKKKRICDSELAESEESNTNNHKHTTQLIQEAPQEKGRGWCANHTTRRAQKALSWVKCQKRSNFQKMLESTSKANDLQFEYVFRKNARIAIVVLKFKWRKGIQVCIYIYIMRIVYTHSII